MLKDMTDADYKKIEQKLSNLGIRIDASTIRRQIEAAVGATPFNATVSFGNARASLDAIFSNNQYSVHVNAIASRLHASIKAALDGWSGAEASILPKKAQLRKAVTDALLASGFEINVNKVKGLSATINGALNSQHTLNVSVDPKKLASAIEKAAKAYKGKDISVEIKEKVLKDSIRAALRTEKFPIRVIVDKAEAQDAVRQALQAAGLQSRTGFTAADKRAWDAESRRMEAQARVAAQNALAQRRLAGAHNTARAAADAHIRSSISLGAAMRGNIHIAGELGPMLASAYSIVALKSFLQKVVEIGGELEKQHLAVKAILGDEGMANTISSQINALAVKSPFGIMELNQYAKQLTAFQIPYNELYDTMKRMADVSAAVGVDMGRIILAYGQVRAAKFLKGTELRQFTEANIPLIDMLAERFTKLKGEIVSAADIMDMISNKEVSFEDVKAVLWELTGEGGKFYNMQEVLSESVQAKWKNLADAIDLMYADIADSLSKPLKGTAEILTELTSKWSTIATVAAAAAAAFGAVKVTTLLLNTALGNNALQAIAQAKATKAVEKANLRVASTYRPLTVEEKTLLGTKKALTAEDYRQMVAEGALTKEQTLRLIALKKISAAQAHYLMTQGLITVEEYKSAIAAKAWRVQLEQLRVSMINVGRSALSFLLNPITLFMAAAGAAVALWQRNSEEAEAAEDMGKDMFTKATEGARNLGEQIDALSESSAEMNETALISGIDKLKQLINDYSDTPKNLIADSLINEQGEVASLAEQYDTLLASVKELLAAYKEAERLNLGKMFGDAIEIADGGWFDDNLLTDIKDYQDAWNDAQKAIAKYAKEYKSQIIKAVDEAKKADAGFAEATKGMRSYEAMYAELIRNAEKYAEAIDILKHKGGRAYLGYLEMHGPEADITKSRKELLAEWTQTLESYKTQLLMQNIDVDNMSGPLKTALISTFKKAMEGVEGPVKKQMEDLVRSIFPALEITNDDLRASIAENFASAIKAASPQLANEMRYGKVYQDLSASEKALVDKLVKQAVEDTKKAYPTHAADLQAMLDASDFIAKIHLSFVAGDQRASDLQKMLWKNVGIMDPKYTSILERWSSGAGSVLEVRESAVKQGKDIKARLDAAKKNANVTKEAIAAIQREWDDAALTFKESGFGSLEDAVKSTGSKKDTDAFAESLKQRFKDIKDAWSEFQKWSKTEGRGAAAKRIGESGLFSTLSADEIPQTVEEYRGLVEKLKNELQAAGVKGTARESLLNELLKQLLAIDKTIVDERLKIALDTVSREAERQLADWNLFDKIRKATGNENLAMSIAFGMNADVTTDYPAMIKQQLQKSVEAAESALATAIPKEGESPYVVQGYNYDKLKELYDARSSDEGMKAWMAVPEEIRKAWEKANSDILKYFDQQKQSVVDILAKYQSLQDKIAKIDYDRNEEIRKINESKDLTPEQKAQTIQRINVEADYQKFTQSNEYLRFFNDIYGLTLDEANRIGDLIQLNLNQKLQAGLITIYEYEKEMGKVRKQLESLRNVKSNAMTFLTGGIKGLNAKRLQQAEGELANNKDYQKALADQIAAQNALNSAKESGNDEAIQAAEEQLALANQSVKTFTALRDGIIKNEESWQNVADVAGIVANIAGGISDAFYAIKDIAASFGVDTDSGAWLDVGAVVDTLTSVTSGVSQVLGSLLQGDIGGAIGGVFKTIATPFTIWGELHDKKLSKMIERSKEAAQIMQNQYDILEKQMASFLGNAANMRIEGYEGQGGAYGKQRELMQGQLAELEKQRQLEMDKKKSDDSVVEDYNKQIEEMKISIRDFAQEAANAIYGIDLKSWASELGDALFEAWKKGEDGAEAFKRKASEIIGTVLNNIFRLKVLEPMMQQLADDLFGKDGEEGIFGKDFELTSDEVLDYVVTNLMKIGDAAKDYAEFMDEAEKRYQKETGESLKDMGSKSSMTAGIQSLTEDTGSLLASYFNAFRADASEQTHVLWPRLLDDVLPQMNVIAQSQLDAQRQIAENTLRNAIAAEAIQASTAKLVELNDQMSRSWRRIAERNWGYS